MAKKIKFYHLWEARDIIVTVLVAAVIIVFFAAVFYNKQLLHIYKTSQYDTNTHGRLIDISEQTMITQSKLGNKFTVDHYKVTYSYTVEEKTYTQTDIVPGTPVNSYELDKIKKSARQQLVVRYNSKDPAKSMVVLEK